jgi:hypothetical protein
MGFTAITKAARSFFRFGSTSQERRHHDGTEASPEKNLSEAIADILRARRFPYLHTLWRELRSAYCHMEMSRVTY